MKHLLGRVLALVVTLSISMGSQSAMFTGNDLQKYCADEEDGTLYLFCVGFISGATQGHQATSLLNEQDTLLFCLPDNVTNGQLTKVVTKFLKNHPEKLHYAATTSIYLALNGAFPCEDDQ